jgi:PAS domain S-box-containing protein
MRDGDDKGDFDALALDGLALGVFVVDADWTIRSFNAEAERITGYRRDEVLGRKCHEVFYSRACAEGCHLRRAMASGRPVRSGRLDILDKSGGRRVMEITASALTDASGRVVGGVQSFCDAEARQAPSRRTVAPKALGDFVGRDEKILRIFETLSLAAATCAPILIQGETGTGKDLLARAAHGLSSRRDGPFVKINCAALPEPLLESELFGYKKGAFTDARTDKPGILQMAQGGTVFFDEIGELPLGLQSKLLQVIEERRFHPLGATAPCTVDVRVVAATNRNLASLADAGGFRRDLYFRLRVLEIEVPPLRCRKGDIPLLVRHFLDQVGGMYNKRVEGADPAVMAILFGHDYPGNVRELLHVVEHAVILAKDTVLHPRDLPRSLTEAASGAARSEAPPPTGGPLERSERECLLAELEACGWNMAATAKKLGINRSTLWRKMKRHGV